MSSRPAKATHKETLPVSKEKKNPHLYRYLKLGKIGPSTISLFKTSRRHDGAYTTPNLSESRTQVLSHLTMKSKEYIFSIVCGFVLFQESTASKSDDLSLIPEPTKWEEKLTCTGCPLTSTNMACLPSMHTQTSTCDP